MDYGNYEELVNEVNCFIDDQLLIIPSFKLCLGVCVLIRVFILNCMSYDECPKIAFLNLPVFSSLVDIDQDEVDGKIISSYQKRKNLHFLDARSSN